MLAHDDDSSRNYLTMTIAYRALLWMLSLLILVVLPSAAGARLVQSLERRRMRDPDEQKIHTNHWILRYIGHGVRLFIAVPFIFLRVVYTKCRNKLKSRRSGESVLVLSSSDGSRHGPRTTPSSPSVRSMESKWRSFTIGGVCGIVISRDGYVVVGKLNYTIAIHQSLTDNGVLAVCRRIALVLGLEWVWICIFTTFMSRRSVFRTHWTRSDCKGAS